MLSDPGRFAYCGLVTGSLVHLFCDNNNYNDGSESTVVTTPTTATTAATAPDFDFALCTMNRLARHLGLPEQVRIELGFDYDFCNPFFLSSSTPHPLFLFISSSFFYVI